MRFIVAILIIAVAFAASATTVYKRVDKNGIVTYTDTPQAGAEPVDLSQVNSAQMPAMTTQAVSAKTQIGSKDRGPSFKLELVSPLHEQTVRANAGNITISAKLSPQAAGMYQLLMDGEIIDTQPKPVFNLTNVDRGAHEIQVHFLQNRGKILASTPLSTFYLKRASILINPN